MFFYHVREHSFVFTHMIRTSRVQEPCVMSFGFLFFYKSHGKEAHLLHPIYVVDSLFHLGHSYSKCPKLCHLKHFIVAFEKDYLPRSHPRPLCSCSSFSTIFHLECFLTIFIISFKHFFINH